MRLPEDIRISGDRTVADWQEFRQKLDVDKDENWQIAFDDYFMARINTRYLDPIDTLQNGNCNGEGFSIVTIHCALIEFLQATRDGLKYVYRNSDTKNHEYNSSSQMFVNFLRSAQFGLAEDQAEDFYKSVRCKLLHEARTGGNWKIKSGSSKMAIVADGNNTIIYREKFHENIVSWIQCYRKELTSNRKLKVAFKRKIDSLCEA